MGMNAHNIDVRNLPGHSPPLNEFQLISSGSHFYVWYNRLLKRSFIQYPFKIANQQFLHNQIQNYIWRYNHDILVSTYYLREQKQAQKYSIFYQRVLTNLSKIKDICFKDSLQIFYAALKGFALLYQKYGYFQVKQDMFHITEQGKIKIWCDRNISKVLPSSCSNGNSQLMINQIIQIIESNMDHSKQKNEIGKIIKNERIYNFEKAIQRFIVLCKSTGYQLNGKLKCVYTIYKDGIQKIVDQFGLTDHPLKQNYILNPQQSIKMITQSSNLNNISSVKPIIISPNPPIISNQTIRPVSSILLKNQINTKNHQIINRNQINTQNNQSKINILPIKSSITLQRYIPNRFPPKQSSIKNIQPQRIKSQQTIRRWQSQPKLSITNSSRQLNNNNFVSAQKQIYTPRQSLPPIDTTKRTSNVRISFSPVSSSFPYKKQHNSYEAYKKTQPIANLSTNNLNNNFSFLNNSKNITINNMQPNRYFYQNKSSKTQQQKMNHFILNAVQNNTKINKISKLQLKSTFQNKAIQNPNISNKQKQYSHNIIKTQQNINNNIMVQDNCSLQFSLGALPPTNKNMMKQKRLSQSKFAPNNFNHNDTYSTNTIDTEHKSQFRSSPVIHRLKFKLKQQTEQKKLSERVQNFSVILEKLKLKYCSQLNNNSSRISDLNSPINTYTKRFNQCQQQTVQRTEKHHIQQAIIVTKQEHYNNKQKNLTQFVKYQQDTKVNEGDYKIVVKNENNMSTNVQVLNQSNSNQIKLKSKKQSRNKKYVPKIDDDIWRDMVKLKDKDNIKK